MNTKAESSWKDIHKKKNPKVSEFSEKNILSKPLIVLGFGGLEKFLHLDEQASEGRLNGPTIPRLV